jgi:nitrite reductase/ring-hydroxylating ferredoxin subunit
MIPGQSDARPLWRDEFPIRNDEERYVTRRQFAKFLVLTSAGMLAGNLWILVKSLLARGERHAPAPIARASEIPVGGVKLFRYPGPHDACILVRLDEATFVAYSQKCTHLSCAVYYSAAARRLECPCHEGYFSVATGQVLQGPPPRPLPRIRLERRGDLIVAVGVALTDTGI